MSPSKLDAPLMWGRVSLLRYEVKDLLKGAGIKGAMLNLLAEKITVMCFLDGLEDSANMFNCETNEEEFEMMHKVIKESKRDFLQFIAEGFDK